MKARQVKKILGSLTYPLKHKQKTVKAVIAWGQKIKNKTLYNKWLRRGIDLHFARFPLKTK